jgi:hypothetical protein
METGISVRSVPRLDIEDQLPLRQSLETVVRRLGGWCEMAASLRGRFRDQRNVRCWKTLPSSRVKTVIEICVWFVKCCHEFYVKVSNKSDYRSKPRLPSLITWQYFKYFKIVISHVWYISFFSSILIFFFPKIWGWGEGRMPGTLSGFQYFSTFGDTWPRCVEMWLLTYLWTRIFCR